MDVVLQRVVHDSRGMVRDEVIVCPSGKTWELQEGRIAEDQFLREAISPLGRWSGVGRALSPDRLRP